MASGKVSILDKVVSLGGSTAFNLVRSGGLKKEAARRAKNYRGQEKRLATGKAKVLDVLKAYGTVNVYSLVGAARKKTDHEL